MTTSARQEKQERIRAFAAQWAQMSADEQTAAIGDAVFTVAGHALSGLNTAIALLQYPGVTVVGGYRQWQAAGRQVKKGEKSLGIFAPRSVKGDNDEELNVRFTMVNVFDISQTEEVAA